MWGLLRAHLDRFDARRHSLADEHERCERAPREAGTRHRLFRFGGRVGGGAREAAFILRHWHPTGDVVRSGDRVKQVLSCDQFDPVHRTCMAHDDRPPVCSGFPFYGQEPHGSFREPHCSYLLDVPPADRPEGSRPLIPLEIIRARN